MRSAIVLLLTIGGVLGAAASQRAFDGEPVFVPIREPLAEKAANLTDADRERIAQLERRIKSISLNWKTASGANHEGMEVAEVVLEEKKSAAKGPKRRQQADPPPPLVWSTSLSDSEFKSYKRMAQWSAAAYCPEASLLSWSCGPRCAGLTENTRVALYFRSPITETVGFIGSYVDMDNEMDIIVVAFRGSAAFTAWVETMKNTKEPSPWPDSNHAGARVHSGFLDAYADIASSVRAVVMMLIRRYPEGTVVVTGHSLGGAVATLCAADLKYHLGQASKVELVTFGSPRVGNDDFAGFMNFIFQTSATDPAVGNYETRRFTNQDDPVIHLPPTFLLFQHINQEIWVSMGNQTVACSPDVGEDPACSNSVLLPENVDAHFYIWDTKFGLDCSY
jgi:hypothetical protein